MYLFMKSLECPCMLLPHEHQRALRGPQLLEGGLGKHLCVFLSRFKVNSPWLLAGPPLDSGTSLSLFLLCIKLIPRSCREDRLITPNPRAKDCYQGNHTTYSCSGIVYSATLRKDTNFLCFTLVLLSYLQLALH